jgi:hypothetical protein
MYTFDVAWVTMGGWFIGRISPRGHGIHIDAGHIRAPCCAKRLESQ